MGGVTLYRSYEVRDEVHSPLINVLHLGPLGLHALLAGYNAVLCAQHRKSNDQNYDGYQPEAPERPKLTCTHSILLVLRIVRDIVSHPPATYSENCSSPGHTYHRGTLTVGTARTVPRSYGAWL